MTKRLLARLRRALRAPMCPHCRVRHVVDSRSVDFLLYVVRAEERRRRHAALRLKADQRAEVVTAYLEGARPLDVDAFSQQTFTRIIDALDLWVEQADGSRPLTVRELQGGGR